MGAVAYYSAIGCGRSEGGMGRPPGTDYVSSLHGRGCVCWVGWASWGRLGVQGLLLLPLSSVVGPPVCVCFVHVAWWPTGGFPRVRPHGRVDLREI